MTSPTYHYLLQAKEVLDEASQEAATLLHESRQRAAARVRRTREKLKRYRQRQEQENLRTSQSLLELYLEQLASKKLLALHDQALSLALAVTQQLIESTPELTAQALSRLLTQGFERLVETNRARIYAHPLEVEGVRHALDKLSSEASATVLAGECPRGTITIETSSGRIDLAWQTALHDFARRAKDLLHSKFETKQQANHECASLFS